MKKDMNFTKFGTVLEAEVLTEDQMDALEGGKSTCEGGCKKACLSGSQNSAKKVELYYPGQTGTAGTFTV